MLAKSDADDKIAGGMHVGSVWEDIGHVLEELDEDQDPPPVPASPNVNVDILEELEAEQDPPLVPASPGSSIMGSENDRFQWQPHPLPEPILSDMERLEIEHEGLINLGVEEEGQ
ncbi:hypothetical protein PISMIDRAFT_6889 [Pisolithus microcarpus 441]|uniref:Uncharacterized protein n=1 Tax=Pisolithus microcarpus 441 TaxID=765257 RepID=A0A0C9YX14_9AGAM|nr:hypothetical protein BKA83DRAFT_6889 [Pisolithus microcarpus]KIK29645.1 hypothetical protein PISMIDRAFT_6889 [Pisolithus microcarpus 441]